MLIYKLDYVIEKEQTRRRDAARCVNYAAQGARPTPGMLRGRLGRLAKQLAEIYVNHQAWKAHDGVFAPLALARRTGAAGVAPQAVNARRVLRQLAGVKLSAAEAAAVWPQVLEHKWYLGERLGRDVGLRVAAADYFENVRPPRKRAASLREWQPLPRLPMMLPFGERA